MTKGFEGLEDWGQLISFSPGQTLRPASLDELRSTLERVRGGEGGGRVRVPGSLHSCSEIVVSDTILDTSGLPKTIDFEAGDAAVVASANVTLHDFLAELSTPRQVGQRDRRHRSPDAGRA